MIHNVTLIDDNTADNFYHSFIIHQADPKVSIQTYTDPFEGLNSLINQPIDQPHLVFLDINMPSMDGYDFLSTFTLKSMQSDSCQLIIVMLTNSLNEADADRALNFPAVKKFVTKPLTPEMYTDLVDSFL